MSTPITPPDADTVPTVLGNKVAAITANTDTNNIGLIDRKVPTVWDIAHKKKPNVMANDKVWRVTLDLLILPPAENLGIIQLEYYPKVMLLSKIIIK